MGTTGDGAEIVAFRDDAAFEEWLDRHGDRQEGVWLKLARKGSGITSMTADEAVDVGLCYGWISGQRRALDDDYFLQKYVPRRPRSRWSQVNVARVEQLLAAGRMRPSGLAEVAAAKADGRWAVAYESQREATVPPDLAEALARDAPATAAFDALNRTDRYAIILKLATARTPEARARQLDRSIRSLRQARAASVSGGLRDGPAGGLGRSSRSR